MRRRKFIQIGLSSLFLYECIAWSKLAHAIPPRPIEKEKKGKIFLLLRSDKPGHGILRIFDWDNYSSEDISVPLGNMHSVTRSKANPNEVYIFEFLGGFLKLNLLTKKLVKLDLSAEPNKFWGHGVADLSKALVYCTEFNQNEKQRGTIGIRSTATLEKVGVLPIEFGSCHQIVRMPNSNIIACANDALYENGNIISKGGVTFCDLEKNVVLKRIPFNHAITHILPISGTEVVGVPAEMRGNVHDAGGLAENRHLYRAEAEKSWGIQDPMPLVYANLNGDHREFWDDAHKEYFQYNLGLGRVAGKNIFLTGHMQSNKVLLWKDFKVLKVFEVHSPSFLVVSKDSSEFMVIAQENLKFFSLRDFKELLTIPDDQQTMGVSYST